MDTRESREGGSAFDNHKGQYTYWRFVLSIPALNTTPGPNSEPRAGEVAATQRRRKPLLTGTGTSIIPPQRQSFLTCLQDPPSRGTCSCPSSQKYHSIEPIKDRLGPGPLAGCNRKQMGRSAANLKLHESINKQKLRKNDEHLFKEKCKSAPCPPFSHRDLSP